MSFLTYHDRYLASSCEDFDKNARDDEIERIGADEDRLHDAVMDFDDAANKLADLRVTMAGAAWLLGKIAEGLTLDEIERLPGHTGVIDDFRALIRAADAADAFVTERVEEAAAEAVEVRA